MNLPLDDINDGYRFQQIAAAYFRSLRNEKHDYHLADVDVDDNGVGPDGGVDILVEFHYSDVISKHTFRWVIECKCWDKNLSIGDINLDNIQSLVEAKNAHGYLLICKGSVTNPLKQRFRDLTKNSRSNTKYEIWDGTRFWQEINERTSLLKAFFPDYYKKRFLENNALQDFKNLVEQFEGKFKQQ